MSTVRPGEIVWEPSDELREQSGLGQYLRWLEKTHGLRFNDPPSLWTWSVEDLDAFWSSVWEYERVQADGSADRVLAEERMPGARWFPDVQVSYAEHLLRQATDDRPALVHIAEDTSPAEVSWSELQRRAGAFADHLRAVGVCRGDRVVAYLGTGPEAVIGLIAVASIGAIWSICAPDYGVLGVRSRFTQLAPKVLIACGSYQYGGRRYDRRAEVADLLEGLPSVQQLVWTTADEPPASAPSVVRWSDVTASSPAAQADRVPFDHPLWVLFSSGTTGSPKGIVHGHGGILLEHLKNLRLHLDVRPGDRFLFVGSTSWMVFNLLVSALLTGATVVLLDGNASYPRDDSLWRIAAEQQLSILGVGAGYVHACIKAGVRPAREHDLSGLRQLAVTGSPLSVAGYEWVREHVGRHVWLSSGSGGTDVCSAFVGGWPLLPVRAGRIQAPALGVAVEAWDPAGQRLVGSTGELVVRRPMPSMPLRLWGDDDGSRLRASYFDVYPGAWRHGDFIEFDHDLSCVISGRSDSTLNRNGIRIGTAEIYAAVEALPEVREALIVGVERAEAYYMPLFVHLDDGVDQGWCMTGSSAPFAGRLSPRHVPDEIVFAPGIPHTRTGKKLEVPIKRLLQGVPATTVADPGSIDQPSLLHFYAEFATRRRGSWS